MGDQRAAVSVVLFQKTVGVRAERHRERRELSQAAFALREMTHGPDVVISDPVQALLDCFFALLDMLLCIGGRGVVLPPTGVAVLHQPAVCEIHGSLSRPNAMSLSSLKAVPLIC